MPPKRLFRKYSLLKKILVLLIFFSILLTLLLFLNNFFAIKEIEVISEDKKINIIGLDLVYNNNLVLLNESKQAKALTEKNSFIQSIKLIKKFPNKITVEIKVDQPVAVLKADQGFLYLSETGKIIEKRKEKSFEIPEINYYQNIYYYQSQAGEFVDSREVLTTLKFLNIINELGLKVVSVDIAGVYMVAFNLKDNKIFFTLEKNPQDQEYQLSTIIKQFKIEGREFSSLDLRFEKPVVKLK